MIINCKSQIGNYIERDEIVSAYFNDIRKYPLLTIEEEKLYIQQAQSKDVKQKQRAIEKLVTCNQRFVVSAAMKYCNNNTKNLLDLVNEGNIGLMTAIVKFDINQNVRFITYAAWWIRKAINDYLAEVNDMVIPTNAIRIKALAAKAKNRFFNENERMPDLKELQEYLYNNYNFKVRKHTNLETIQTISIDRQFNNELNESSDIVYAFNKHTADNNVNDDMDRQDAKRMVMALLDKLNDEERLIIKQSFGIDCEHETNGSIGRQIGCNSTTVRHKIETILKKLQTCKINI